MLRAVGEFVWRVPPETVIRLAAELEGREALTSEDVGRIAALADDPGVRYDASRLMESWRLTAGDPRQLGAMLRGAAEAVNAHQDTESAQLVWTGPTSTRAPFRRTDEALLECVRSASRVLTIVTFAAYRVPDVRSALIGALDRGVEVRFVGETESAGDGGLRFDAVHALGQAIATRSRLFEWPPEARPRDPRGWTGRLHAKCALADDAVLLVSSANLTGAALDANMEMGVLLKGGRLPLLAARHFDDLIRTGTLRAAKPRS